MKKFIKSSYFAIVMLFLYIPIGVMIIFSFNSGGTVFDFLGFSNEWYKEFFNNSPFIKSIITSLFVAVVSTIISLIIGVMAAIGLSRSKKVTQRTWFSIANIPLINADVVTAVSLMIVFLLSGMKFGIGSLIFAHISFNVPYVLITVMPRLRKIDNSMIEAASDLGSKPYQILFRVILPVLKPAIITAAAIAFAMSFDDFIISYFTGGDQTNVSTFIYTAKRVKPFIFAFGTLLVAIIVFVILLWNAQAIIRMRRKQIAQEIKEGWYKSKEIDNLNKKLDKKYSMLINETEFRKTYRIRYWFKYFYLIILIKIYSLKNYNKRISKLEWKQYKIRNEIRNEKRYYSRLDKTNKTITKVKREINKKTTDIKKEAKLSLQLEKLLEKKVFLESEIEWIENRDSKASDRAFKIKKQIKTLEKEFNKEKTSLTKKEVSWYKNKIKKLNEYKIEIEEGKNHYKLRMTAEKLKEVRSLKEDKLWILNEKLKLAKEKVYFWKPIGKNFDVKIASTNDFNKIQQLKENKQRQLEHFKNKMEWNIFSIENKIEHIQNKVIIKKEKMFPVDEEGTSDPKSKSFIKKSWKIIVVSLVGIAAFSGLTVAYVKNNIYDLVIGNWGEYIDVNLIKDFQKETGLKVNYQVYDSNETLYNKLYTFNYDLMVPSDYMIQKLAQEEKIEELDWNKLNIQNPLNNEYEANDKEIINGKLKELLKTSTINDKNLSNYSVPYFWGDLVIVFNQEHDKVKKILNNNNLKYDENNHNIINQDDLSWDIIKESVDKNLDVKLSEDPKNLFLIGAQVKYGKVSLDSKEEVNVVSDYTEKLVKKKNVSLQGDNMLSAIQTGDFDVAVMYSGDLVSTYIERDKADKQPLIYGRPHYQNQRTNVYSDGMVISSNARHEDNAYKFMNFMFDYKNAKTNSLYVGLASSNDKALKEISTNEFSKYSELYKPIITNDDYTIDDMSKLTFKYNKEIDPYLVDKFNKIVASKN